MHGMPGGAAGSSITSLRVQESGCWHSRAALHPSRPFRIACPPPTFRPNTYHRHLLLLRSPPASSSSPASSAYLSQVRSGEIVFSNVVFAYKPQNPVLKGVSFRVPGAPSDAFPMKR